MIRKMFLMLVVVFMVSGCVLPTKQDGMLATMPPDYSFGYQAGCESGKLAGGSWHATFTKDPQAYATNDLYRQGWDDGFATCKGTEEDVQSMSRWLMR